MKYKGTLSVCSADEETEAYQKRYPKISSESIIYCMAEPIQEPSRAFLSLFVSRYLPSLFNQLSCPARQCFPTCSSVGLLCPCLTFSAILHFVSMPTVFLAQKREQLVSFTYVSRSYLKLNPILLNAFLVPCDPFDVFWKYDNFREMLDASQCWIPKGLLKYHLLWMHHTSVPLQVPLPLPRLSYPSAPLQYTHLPFCTKRILNSKITSSMKLVPMSTHPQSSALLFHLLL